MIRLLLEGYKREEITKLISLFEQNLASLYTICSLQCDKCNTKRICRDLDNAIDYCHEYISIKFENTQM